MAAGKVGDTDWSWSGAGEHGLTSGTRGGLWFAAGLEASVKVGPWETKQARQAGVSGAVRQNVAGGGSGGLAAGTGGRCGCQRLSWNAARRFRQAAGGTRVTIWWNGSARLGWRQLAWTNGRLTRGSERE